MAEHITLSVNGESLEIEKGTSLLEAAKQVQESYDSPILLAEYQGRLVELFKTVTEPGEVTFLTVKDKNGRRAYRRSLVFLMQKAIDMLFDGQWMDVRVMYSVGTGYYCLPPTDKEGASVTVTEEFLSDLKAKMLELVEAERYDAIKDELEKKGTKTTIPMLEKALIMDEQVIEAKKALREAELVSSRLQVSVSAMDARRSELDNLVKLYVAGYFSTADGAGVKKSANEQASRDARKNLNR